MKMNRQSNIGRKVCITLLAALGLWCQPAKGQVVGATVTGTVSDPSGSAISNGRVSVHNNDTGLDTEVATNSLGNFTISNIQAGTYNILFSADGFGQQLLRDVTVTVGETRVLNAELKVGTVRQEVNVSDVAPDINLTDATMGGVTNSRTIEELPLNARSWTDLAYLQPGVYAIQTQPGITTRDRPNRGYGQQVSISGNRPDGNNYLLDGISINDPTNGGPGSVLGGNLGVDAIAEFNVLTANYSAEYGRANGGIFNAITKSGTNDFHGTLYEFLRNSALDARNFFDGSTIPPFKRNQFGASAGGPIRRNKTFIFGDYEGLRQSLGLSQVSIVPSADARMGILSAGNVVVDPQASRYLNAFYPLPNESNAGSPDTGRFVFGRPQTTSENFFIIRMDHNFSDKSTLHGSYMYDFSGVNEVDEFKNKLLRTLIHRQLVDIEEDQVFSNNFVNSLRIGYSRYFSGTGADTTALNPAVADPSYGFVPGETAGRITIPGVTQFTGGLSAVAPALYHWNSYQMSDEAVLTRGKHSIKFGGSVEDDRANESTEPRPGGFFQFGSLSDFLTNQPLNISTDFAGVQPARNITQSIWGLYALDSYKWRPNVTINFGLRYEPTSVPKEVHGKSASLPTFLAADPHLGSPLFHNNTLKDFSPRISVAWDPRGDGKTSIRTGFGIYDQLPYIGEIGSSISSSYPFLLTGGATNLPAGSFPNDAYFLALNNGATRRIAYVEQNPKRSYVMQWNLSVQRELARDLTGLVGYVGSHGMHGVTQTDDANIVLPTLTPEGYLWPSPSGSGQRQNLNVGREPVTLFRNSAVYDGLQTQITKKMSRGFQIQGSFTWSKSIDIASGATVGDQLTNGISSLLVIDPRLTRARSDFNVGRVASINLLWIVPSPKISHAVGRAVLSGWQVGAIFSASDGQPFTPFIGGDPLGLNSTDPFAYPSRLKTSACRNPIHSGSVNNYINLDCFYAPNPLTLLGNTGRNSITGPGLQTLDFSLVKNTAISHDARTLNVQFRAEFFNILNRANFAPPIDNATLFDQTGAPVPGAGAIDATTTTSRQIQFGLKLIW